jgi:hypothetical protein
MKGNSHFLRELNREQNLSTQMLGETPWGKTAYKWSEWIYPLKAEGNALPQKPKNHQGEKGKLWELKKPPFSDKIRRRGSLGHTK